DSTLTLHPGGAASISPDADITYISQANTREFTDWLDQQLIFESKPAIRVVHELEQQFDISITLPDTVKNNRLSGQLSLESPQVSLNDLTLVLGGTFVRTGERSYRLETQYVTLTMTFYNRYPLQLYRPSLFPWLLKTCFE